MSGHSPLLAFMYSIISTEEFFFFFLPLESWSRVILESLQAISLCISAPFMACQLDSGAGKSSFFLFCFFFFTQTGAHFPSLQMEDKVQLIVGPQGHEASEKIQPGA